jgi:ABC-type multidrug transport system fused ATPase/permease subunit
MKEIDKTILIEEYHQTWEHYRHLENARTKYMNFFFTALFAVFGLYTALIKIDKFEIHEFELVIGIILLYIFSAFTLYVFINITRIGWVLTGYDNVMKELRKLLHDNEILSQKISVRDYLPRESKYKVYSIQYSAETLLKISMMLMNLFIIVIFIIKWDTFITLHLLFLIASFILIFILEIFIIRKGSRRK